ncbi:MAG: transcription antitermination factor NusB, partial [Bacillota bacterium]|nr:transcription antitermination factor NusB [Bacillota bacterium]
ALRELGARHTDEVVDDYLSKYILHDKDRRFFTQIVIGVTEDRIYLDYIIDALSHRKMSEEVREILRIGIYQLLR